MSESRRHFKVEALPPELIDQVQTMILDDSATYQDIVSHLKAMGTPVSRSSVGRYSRHLLERRQQIESTVAVARELLAISHEGDLEGLASTLALDKIVQVLMTVEVGMDDDQPYLSIQALTSIMRSVACLQSAKLSRDKWRVELAHRSREAADAVAKTASRGGLSPELIDDIRQRVLGIGAEVDG